MKRTLIICIKYPLPEIIGTNMRTMNFVRFFHQFGPVDIAYSEVLPDGQTGHPLFSNEYVLRSHMNPGDFRRQLLRSFVKGLPWPIYEFADVSRELLSTTILSNDYDYILVRLLFSTSLLLTLPPKYKQRTIIDFDDLLSGSLYESMTASVHGLHRKLTMSLNRQFLIGYEKRCLQFGASLFCSEKDRLNVAGGNGRINTFVVPNIYENQSFQAYDFGDGFESRNTLLFVGTLNYEPNVKGLEWFVETIFPEFRRKYSDAKLLVVGRSPKEQLRNLCMSSPAVELHGDTPDLRPYYRQSKAVVVPLLSGGGTRIKILEAASARRPVLSTRIGADGLDLIEETDVLFFETADQFLIQYSKLQNSETYHSLIHNAKKNVVSNYSLQNFYGALRNMVNHLDRKKEQRPMPTAK